MNWNSLALEDVCLSNLLTAVRLNTGHCGIALNYDREGFEPKVSDAFTDRLRQRLLERASQEPLLENTLFQEEEGPTFRSLSVALVSALGQTLMCNQHLVPRGARIVSGRPPIEYWGGLGQKVAVIGCGGYAADAVWTEFTTEVVICDFHFGDPDFEDFWGPFVGEVVEPNRHRKSIRLSDGSDTAQVIAECDLLFITGSALINDSLFELLALAKNKAAIVVEGNSAGLYPFPLFQLGVTHLVQTVVDIDYVSLSQRFTRQLRDGHIHIPPVQFTETVLPEMRIVERLPTYDLKLSWPKAEKRVLLLQARDWGDPMIGHEINCFRDKIPNRYELQIYNLTEGPWDESVLDGFSAVLVGGSGAYGSAENKNPWFSPSLEFLRRVVSRGLPLFCSCWGHQALAVALGGRVVHDSRGYELGTLSVQRTSHGSQDPLFAGLPDSFIAPLGHCEQVVDLPADAVLLASTERCPIQAFRLEGRPVYATQFHPELNSPQLWERVQAYIPEEEDGQQASLQIRVDTESLLARFLDEFL